MFLCLYEPHIAEELTQMLVVVAGMHKTGEVTHTLMGVALSASMISQLNQTLTLEVKQEKMDITIFVTTWN